MLSVTRLWGLLTNINFTPMHFRILWHFGRHRLPRKCGCRCDCCYVVLLFHIFVAICWVKHNVRNIFVEFSWIDIKHWFLKRRFTTPRFLFIILRNNIKQLVRSGCWSAIKQPVTSYLLVGSSNDAVCACRSKLDGWPVPNCQCVVSTGWRFL